MDLKRLIKKCLHNDQRAFEKLYNQYAPTFAGICRRYTDSKDEANDILQEAFIKIFNNLDKLKEKSLFEAWARRIVVNTAIQTIKKSQNLISIEQNDIDITEEQEQHSTEVMQNLEMEEIITLLDYLPKGYKTILNLYAIEEYSHKEIGEILNIQEATSRSQYHKAKKAFQKIIVQTITE